jgi:GNAT superfamily N-acetyltransferase
MDQISIRKALATDLEDLYTFEQGVIETERPFDSTLKKGKIRYYDLAEMISVDNIEVVVAELNGRIIGSGYARIEQAKPYLNHETYAYLGFMYVHPAHRGKGINKKIIDALKYWASQHNINELRLEVYYDNLTAIRAYEKIGFKRHMIEMRFNTND